MRKLVAVWLLLVTLAAGGVTAVSPRALSVEAAAGIVWLVAKRRAGQAEVARRVVSRVRRAAVVVRATLEVRVVDSFVCYSLFGRPPPVLSF